MPRRTRTGLTSACRPKRSGKWLPGVDTRVKSMSGAINSDRTENGWQIPIKDIFPITIRALMVSLGWRRWHSIRRINMASMTWREMSGSGLQTGIDPTTTPGLPRPAEWRAIQKAPTQLSIVLSLLRKTVHRGGSFLCTDQYCSRYMVGTRGKGEDSTGTNHLGFRCVTTTSLP
jgi:Sulfatase-modifying factor enzyme 1